MACSMLRAFMETPTLVSVAAGSTKRQLSTASRRMRTRYAPSRSPAPCSRTDRRCSCVPSTSLPYRRKRRSHAAV